jgi:hypothetical protein
VSARSGSARIPTAAFAVFLGASPAHTRTGSHLRPHLQEATRPCKDLLTVKYGYAPSAAKFSDAFNLRAHGTTTISRETARKWIRGEAIPELSRLKVLINWLGLKPSAFLEGEFNAPSIDGAISELNQGSTDENTQSKLISLINELDHKSIETLFIAAWALKET